MYEKELWFEDLCTLGVMILFSLHLVLKLWQISYARLFFHYKKVTAAL